MVRNRETFPVVMPNVVHAAPHLGPGAVLHPRPAGARAPSSPTICSASATSMAAPRSPPSSSSRSPARPACWCRRRAISSGCARSATAHGILLVFDEVITGFGRLGRAFAADAFGVMPDIITMAKALTNGAHPDGRGRGPRRHLRDDHRRRAGERHRVLPRLHLFRPSRRLRRRRSRRSTSTSARASSTAPRALSDYFLDAVWSLRDLPIVRDIRGYGLLAGFEVLAATASPAPAAPSCRSGCSGTAAMSNGPATPPSSRRRLSPSARTSTRSSTACAARWLS